MALVALKCPNCGGTVQMEENLKQGFCVHCGSRILNEQSISGTVSIDKKSDIINHLKIAKEALKMHDWENASKHIENIFLMDPDCKDAWFMKSLLHYRDATGKSYIDKAKSSGMKNYEIFSEEDIRKYWGECNLYVTVRKSAGVITLGLAVIMIIVDERESRPVLLNDTVIFGVNQGKHDLTIRVGSGSVNLTDKLTFIAKKDHKFDIKIGSAFSVNPKITQIS